ncbi:hypothetical protein GQ607_012568 [Colletotrichum asianum]|uniref:Uncharacterized protein n=1 Tax=Colletotrichum asianum TaxID=702518 RepID=A0A8H3W8I5_9PEZI|nr:hypothetical protein GQ607_012568 [Colletotrichum asianum]
MSGRPAASGLRPGFGPPSGPALRDPRLSSDDHDPMRLAPPSRQSCPRDLHNDLNAQTSLHLLSITQTCCKGMKCTSEPPESGDDDDNDDNDGKTNSNDITLKKHVTRN